MMLYFSVPLILVQILLCLLCYPQVIRNYREKTDYSMEQSVNQAISFTKSYLQNMTYLADMVEDSGVIQGILSAEDFGAVDAVFTVVDTVVALQNFQQRDTASV